LQRYHKAGFNTKAAYSGNQPIPGLLKSSISSSKRLKNIGDNAYSLKVGPRGQRVHFYSKKAEERTGYMDQAEAAAVAALKAAAEQAFNRVWKG
jgi:hypothetical protein